MKFLMNAVSVAALTLSAGAAVAACDDGEIVVKFSHVTNTDKHPKGIAATLLMERVNAKGYCEGSLSLVPIRSPNSDRRCPTSR